jgi:FKBP-type peptidyl-prolyl cis-trans isomerase
VRFAIAALIAVSTAGSALAQDKAAPAKCATPPTELVIKEVAPGKGEATAAFRSAVLVQYTGWLYDGCAKDFKGEKFDTSEGRTTPFGFLVGTGKVIKGWDEGVLGMKVGQKRMLIIPPDKAYGERSVGGGKIPAGSTLVFDVEVVALPQPGPPGPVTLPK